jgi:hopanoid biosynthesis associated protein HpnK
MNCPSRQSASVRRQIIFSADDFGISEAVNEGIERAHRDGLLTSASLMVAGQAADDAVRRARTMPGLRVGLHVVVVEGSAVLPPASIPDLVNANGEFSSDQVRLGLRYAFLPTVRHQLRAEINAQFDAFAATGLVLDHADAHKHMHLHPTVGAMIIDSGWAHGLRAMRVPAEPVDVMRLCGVKPTLAARAMLAWTRVLRRKARLVGLHVNDHVFGLAWSGQMTADKLLRLAQNLPDGVSEIYFHPAARRDALLERLMPDYGHEEELEALCNPTVRLAFEDVDRIGYGDL